MESKAARVHRTHLLIREINRENPGIWKAFLSGSQLSSDMSMFVEKRPTRKKKRNLGKDHGPVTGVHMVQAIVLEPQARQDYSQGSLRRTLKEDCALLLGLISLRVTYLKKKS